MLIEENERKNKLNKMFLLVFHGGLVCYLILHNLIIPFVRNIGQGNMILQEVHYWFVPQSLLFFSFYFYPFGKKNPLTIFSLLGANIVAFGLGLIEILLSIGKGISVESFSSSISLLAIACFFLGYFVHFKKFYIWKGAEVFKIFILSLGIGGSFFFIQEKIVIHSSRPKQNPFVSEVNNEGIELKKNTVEIHLPKKENFSNSTLTLSDNGYYEKVSYFNKEQKVLIQNRSTKKHILRLERLNHGKWNFMIVLVLTKDELVEVSLKEKGIYRLRSPSSKEIGIHYIVRDAENFPDSTYSLTKNKVEIKNE